MGMRCEVNSILKLATNAGYPSSLKKNTLYSAVKEDYRILLVDVPIVLVNEHWEGTADVIIRELTWKGGNTYVTFEVNRIYKEPVKVKET